MNPRATRDAAWTAYTRAFDAWQREPTAAHLAATEAAREDYDAAEERVQRSEGVYPLADRRDAAIPAWAARR